MAALRGRVEEGFVVGFYNLFNPPLDQPNSLKVLGLTEKNRELEEENQVLRKQLGAIPEKAKLLPAQVIWQSEAEFIVEFNYANNQDLVGQPVVLGDVYLGRVLRVGKRLLVVESPVSSKFVAKGITASGQEGRLIGQFNSDVVFEVAANYSIAKNKLVYYLEPEKGWRFLLGKVSKVNQNKRLPVKQAIIDYLPSKTKLKTVFVVL